METFLIYFWSVMEFILTVLGAGIVSAYIQIKYYGRDEKCKRHDSITEKELQEIIDRRPVIKLDKYSFTQLKEKPKTKSCMRCRYGRRKAEDIPCRDCIQYCNFIDKQ